MRALTHRRKDHNREDSPHNDGIAHYLCVEYQVRHPRAGCGRWYVKSFVGSFVPVLSGRLAFPTLHSSTPNRLLRTVVRFSQSPRYGFVGMYSTSQCDMAYVVETLVHLPHPPPPTEVELPYSLLPRFDIPYRFSITLFIPTTPHCHPRKIYTRFIIPYSLLAGPGQSPEVRVQSWPTHLPKTFAIQH